MTPQLSDRMHDLAAEVSAPPTADAREAVGRRAHTLRRRRRARQVAGGGLLALAVTAAVVAVTPRSPDDPDTDVAGGPRGPAPAGLTVDLGDWQVTAAGQAPPAGDDPVGSDPTSSSLQIFRRDGELAGPTVFLHHRSASDAVVPQPEDEVSFTTTDGRDVTGELRKPGPGAFDLTFAAMGDSHAELVTTGLTRDEVLDVATELRQIDPDIQWPAVEETFGFEAAALPVGLQEVPAGQVTSPAPQLWRVALSDGDASAEVVADDRGQAAVDSEIEGLVRAGGTLQPTTVQGHPGVLAELPDGTWAATWLHDADQAATVTLSGVDRDAVDEVLAAIRPVPATEWDELVADHPVP